MGSTSSADFIQEQRAMVRTHIESATWGSGLRAARTELLQLGCECQSENWDGYGAAPVHRTALINAYRFLESLPLLNFPSISADPDGDVAFEWYSGPRRTLTVSINSEGDLHYSALIGQSKSLGTEPFVGEIPNVIAALIQRVQE